jgi:hypothetical protein
VVTGLAIYLPPAQSLLGTRPLTWGELVVLMTFPVVVWAADEAYRGLRRRQTTLEDAPDRPNSPAPARTQRRPSI